MNYINSLRVELTEHKWKILNIFYHIVKYSLYMLLFAYYSQKYSDKHCTSLGQIFTALLFDGNIGFTFVNLFALLFIAFKKNFPRLEFFIIYITNLLWFFSLLVFDLITISVQNDCSAIYFLQKTFLIISIKSELETLIFMVLPQKLTVKHLNFGTNLTFPIIILTEKFMKNCDSSISDNLIFKTYLLI